MRSTWLLMSVLIGSAASSVYAAEGASPYTTAGRCDGLPKVSVTTPTGVCVGLLASAFKFPRGVLPLDDGDVMVVDMGGWTPRRGSLWLLKKASGYRVSACSTSSIGRTGSCS